MEDQQSSQLDAPLLLNQDAPKAESMQRDDLTYEHTYQEYPHPSCCGRPQLYRPETITFNDGELFANLKIYTSQRSDATDAGSVLKGKVNHNSNRREPAFFVGSVVENTEQGATVTHFKHNFVMPPNCCDCCCTKYPDKNNFDSLVPVPDVKNECCGTNCLQFSSENVASVKYRTQHSQDLDNVDVLAIIRYAFTPCRPLTETTSDGLDKYITHGYYQDGTGKVHFTTRKVLPRPCQCKCKNQKRIICCPASPDSWSSSFYLYGPPEQKDLQRLAKVTFHGPGETKCCGKFVRHPEYKAKIEWLGDAASNPLVPFNASTASPAAHILLLWALKTDYDWIREYVPLRLTGLPCFCINGGRSPELSKGWQSAGAG